VKTHRDDLVIAITRAELLETLNEWNALTGRARRERFKPTGDRVSPEAHEVASDLFLKHRYRPLDDRYLYGNKAFIDRPGRIWPFYEGGLQTRALLSMDTRTGSSPAVIATNTLPGYNSFRGSYETHVYPLVAVGQLDEEALSVSAREWADRFEASTEDVAAYLLALGNAPLYGETFREAMESEMVRFPATTDEGVFSDAVEVGARLLAAWSLEAAPRGEWEQSGGDAPLGAARLDGDVLSFENGDRLRNVHPDSFAFDVSGHNVLPEYLSARAHSSLTGELAADIRRVVGALYVILEERAVCDALLERAVAAPMQSL
jgi:hypothetical protein